MSADIVRCGLSLMPSGASKHETKWYPVCRWFDIETAASHEVLSQVIDPRVDLCIRAAAAPRAQH
jgi:hypothetical protein